MTNTGELGSAAFNRLGNIPSTISIGSVVEYINYGKIDVETYMGDTIDTSNVQTKYQNILISVGCMYTLCKMLGINADFDVQMGEFQIDRSDKSSPEFRAMQFYQTHINETMKIIKYGGTIHFTKVYGV